MKYLICLLALAASNLPTSAAAATRAVPDSKLIPLVAQALSDAFELDQARLVLEPSRPLSPVAVPQDTANISIKLLNNPYARPSSFMKAQYAILADGLPVAEHTSYFKAQLLQDVWVAQQVAQRGVTLAEAKIIQKKTNVINLRGAVWIGKPDDSLQLISTLSPGIVLQERHLRRTPVILRNQSVEAVLSHKSLTIRLRVVALEDGAPGQMIRLRNTSSAKEIRGTVVNSREVKVTF